MTPNDQSFFHAGGPAGVLLIHGLTGTPREMRYVGKGLAKAGFTVYGLQLAGHCGSEEDLLATGWPDWIESVERAHETLSRECDTIFAAGLSMGAVLALELAYRRPDSVHGLALYSTTLWYDGWSIPQTRRFSFLLPLVLKMGLGTRRRFVESFPYGIKDERLRQRVVAGMKSGNSAAAGLEGTPWPSLNELRHLVARVKRNMPAIKTPTLILHAANDDVTSRRNADYVERRLSGPVSKILLDDCYHMITVDQERDRVTAATADFFRGLVEPPNGAAQAGSSLLSQAAE